MLADAHAHWQRACVERRKSGGAARGALPQDACRMPYARGTAAQISAREQTDLCGGIESGIAELGRAPATPGSSCPTVPLPLPPPAVSQCHPPAHSHE